MKGDLLACLKLYTEVGRKTSALLFEQESTSTKETERKHF